MCVFMAIGCQQEQNKQQYMEEEAAKNVGKYSNIKFSIDKDVVCDMKLSSGISDTAHYKGEIFGFCCKFCKDDFQKDAEHFLSK